MTPVFADTFYWVALANRKDSYHVRVRQLDRSRYPLLVTTEEVLTEFLTFCATSPQLRSEAVAAVQDILHAPDVRVLPQTHATFLSGLELYRSRLDKAYSLTDCISMQAMRRERLTRVLTNDRHFEQEGFLPLLRR